MTPTTHLLHKGIFFSPRKLKGFRLSKKISHLYINEPIHNTIQLFPELTAFSHRRITLIRRFTKTLRKITPSLWQTDGICLVRIYRGRNLI